MNNSRPLKDATNIKKLVTETNKQTNRTTEGKQTGRQTNHQIDNSLRIICRDGQAGMQTQRCKARQTENFNLPELSSQVL